ncbi:MAG TPA: hypothetical protein VEU11_06100 [Terriglobales bacterium]|nr:hypothetical protein [Terriglobales bacterium]
MTTRKDKTGSRTFGGLPPGGRRKTTFELRTLLTTWPAGTNAPSYGPLFEATLGGGPVYFPGGTLAAGSSATTLHFAAAHGLVTGQAVTYLGDLRFVAAVLDPLSVLLNAPLSTTPIAGASAGATATYVPSTELPSVSVFDYWDPNSAVHRILCGAGVDQMSVKVNGDYQEFAFSGVAQELLDSTSFSGGIGGLTSFPAEPPLGAFDYSIVPGHLGQVWLGNGPDQFFTLTGAELVASNNLDMRAREFGTGLPRALSPGTRAVSINFELYQQDDTATKALYQAAKQQSPITAMLQLGQQPNQLFGAYLQSVLPEVPEFDDKTNRLQWRFSSSRAQGTVNDEIRVAFG